MPATATTDKTLTERQRMLLTFIYDYAMTYGYQPNMDEMCDRMEIASKNGVMAHLKAMANKGYFGKTYMRGRGLELLRRPDGTAFKGFVFKD